MNIFRRISLVAALSLLAVIAVDAASGANLANAVNGQILFVSNRDGNDEIYKMNSDGFNQQRLTNSPEGESNGKWSPDNRKILFNKLINPTTNQIWVMNADGSSQIMISDATGNNVSNGWSPDGQKILFTKGQTNSGGRIWIMNADGSNKVQITDTNMIDHFPVWSPDSGKIAFGRCDTNFVCDIFTMTADGSNQINLTPNNPNDDDSPKWTPDGSKIVFGSQNTPNDYNVYVMNADGTNKIPLTNNSVQNFQPSAISPNGRSVAMIFRPDGFTGEIATIGINGGNLVNLTNNSVQDFFGAWSPDSNKIAFTNGNTTATQEIYVMNADGSSVVRLTSNSARDFVTDWQAIVSSTQSVRKVELFGSPLGNASSGEVAVISSTGLVYTAGQAFGSNYGVIDPNTNTLIKVIRPADLNNQSAVFFSRTNQTTKIVYFLRGSTQIDAIDGRAASPTFNQLLPSLTFSNQTIAAFAIDQTRNRMYVTTRVTGSNPVQSNLLTIDGDPNSATFHQVLTTTALPAGQQAGHVAVNATTNKVYVASQLSGGGVFVFNVAAQTLTKITSTIQTAAIVINETSNTVYAGLNGTFTGGVSSIQAIDGVNDTLTININTPGAFSGTFGEFGAVNSITERVYTILSNGSLGVIDAKRTSPTFNQLLTIIPNVGTSGEVAVSEQLNKIVVATGNRFDTLIIDGATNVAAIVKGNAGSADVTINPLTGRAFVGCVFYTTQNINLNDNSFTSIGTITEIGEGLVNPNNNSFYLGRSSAIADLIFFNQNDTLGLVTGEPHEFGRILFVAQNKATNRMYFVNSAANLTATDRSPGFVAVVDGATNNVVANVEVGGQPFSNPVVNETTNKIYLMNAGFGTGFPSKISVINGATNTASDVNTSAFPANSLFIREPAVNPTTNKIYFRVSEGTSVGVINGATDVAVPLPGYSNVFDIKVSPTLNRIYLLTSTGLRVLNGANDTEIANIALSSPSNLTINQTTGKIYVQQFNQTGTLSVIDPNTNTVTATVPLDNGGSMIVNEATNELYVTKTTDFNNEGTSSIIFINGDSLSIRKTLPVPLRAGRLTVNPVTKTLYVTTVNASQRTGVVIISLETNRTQFDFDGDGKSDISVFRPNNGVWYLQQSSSGFTGLAFGLSTDKLVPADYDGDGKTDVAVYRNGIWYLQRSQAGFTGIAFGSGEDVPQPADFDGDGKAEIAVFRPSNGVWYVLNLANNQFNAVQFGQSGDKPVAADYDGDGKADYAVYRAGVWYIQRSQLGFTGTAFGEITDKTVAADYDGDGKTDVAVFRPSNGVWYLLQSTAGFTGIAFGLGTDLPVPADYDGDGKADVAVFRDGIWYLRRSTQGFIGVPFGLSTDTPVPNVYVR